MRNMTLIVWCALFAVTALTAPLQGGQDKATALVRTRLSRELTYADLVKKNIDVLALYRDGRVDLAVTGEQLDWLRSRSLLTEVLERASLRGVSDLDENLGLYHTYAEMESDLDTLVLLYPSLTRLDTVGFSLEGRVIRALKISDNADIDESEAEVLIMGCHHARELMSVEVPLYLVHYLLENYGLSPAVTEMVDNREIWIAPMINPDGHVYVQNNHLGDWWGWWRKNRRDNGDGTHGVDLNRNYGYMWGYDDVGSSPNTSSPTYRGPGPFSEPETQAVRDFCNTREFTASLSYHSYGELIIYPWGYDAIYTDDHELFSVLADSLQRGNDYLLGCTATSVLYPTNGDTDDWAYGDTSLRDKIFAYTIELNSYEEGGFGPPDSLIQPTCEKVLELNLTLIRRAGNPYGVLGPYAPLLAEVEDLADPSHLLSWSGGNPADPNPPVSYEIVEYKELEGTADPCEAGDTRWTMEGFSLSTGRAFEGSSSYYSGMGNDLNRTLTMEIFYPVSFGYNIFCFLWYDIEEGYDYAYLEASLDFGLTWQTVWGDVTTNSNPSGNNRGNGITGQSGEWVPANFNLGFIDGIEVDSVLLLRFCYCTDSYVEGEGIYIDYINPVSTCEYYGVIEAACTDTAYVRTASETGEFAYQVRALDSEGHQSKNSNVVFYTVTDVTGEENTPAYRSGLVQNFPNPFNPTTRIQYTVGAGATDVFGTAAVYLALYDISGRRVAVLKNGREAAGEYSLTWDGRGQAGRTLASGVYFMRLTVGGEKFTRKMVLLR
ncbi:MAG: immune inhibitor A [Candidatus Krumholzibacteriota bacterium]|nr:immune inhibitor A [Candidatus Krumholzibacteriota bacterium]